MSEELKKNFRIGEKVEVKGQEFEVSNRGQDHLWLRKVGNSKLETGNLGKGEFEQKETKEAKGE